MFSWLNIIKILAPIVLIILLYSYWNYSQAKIEELSRANSLLESVVNTQDNTIKTLKDNYNTIQKNLNDLNEQYKTITIETDRLKTVIKIPKITKENKDIIEKKINDDLNNLFKSIEEITLR